MQYYTVKQLSKMLSCLEDTIRRKIRAKNAVRRLTLGGLRGDSA